METVLDSVTDASSGRLRRIAGQMRVPGGRWNLCMAEQLPVHWAGEKALVL